ncbi:hypothetical protein QAD02_018591 [Eretmocerus hayati]|uniref:Uncharacterized protein n=1 Tax=Eretmocerus hayati TaxID=131215 RepID=A0ACC2PHL9_9HYME|nr:hypothetical protein QAD02_018591 [Eretmocerus hayati]
MPRVWSWVNRMSQQPQMRQCDKPHLTTACTKKSEDPSYCVNCGGKHRANSSQCEIYQKRLENIHARRAASNQQGKRQTIQKSPTDQDFPKPRWNHSPALTPTYNAWEIRNQPQQAQIPRQRQTTDKNITDSQELRSELQKLNKLCKIKELLVAVKSLNTVLGEAKTPVDKLQAFHQVMRDGAF